MRMQLVALCVVKKTKVIASIFGANIHQPTHFPITIILSSSPSSESNIANIISSWHPILHYMYSILLHCNWRRCKISALLHFLDSCSAFFLAVSFLLAASSLLVALSFCNQGSQLSLNLICFHLSLACLNLG